MSFTLNNVALALSLYASYCPNLGISYLLPSHLSKEYLNFLGPLPTAHPPAPLLSTSPSLIALFYLLLACNLMLCSGSADIPHSRSCIVSLTLNGCGVHPSPDDKIARILETSFQTPSARSKKRLDLLRPLGAAQPPASLLPTSKSQITCLLSTISM